jgi:DNA repair exonuclease SbcCD ATPase subunit
MKLLELELKDFKRFNREPKNLQFDPRAQVLFGANEAGKSTIFEAVRRVLFDKARTGAKWVDHLVPYGTKASPQVRLDFEHRGRTLRIAKEFGLKGRATLSEHKGGGWQTLATNEDAEALLLELLGAEESKAREGSAPASWGAFQWLFVPQNFRDLPGGNAAAHLGLDAAGVSPEFEALREAADGEYGRSFTPTGRESSSSDLALARARLEALGVRRAELQQAVGQVEERRRLYDERCERLPSARKDAGEAEAEWRAAQAEADGLSGAQGEFNAAGEALKGALDRRAAAAEVVKERRRLEEEREAAKVALAACQGKAAEAEALFRQIEQQWTGARTRAGALGDLVAALRKKAQAAERLQALRNAERELKAQQQTLDRARKVDAEVLGALAILDTNPPKAALIEKAQDLENRIIVAQGAARVAALSVELEGQPKVRILVDGSQTDGAQAVALESVRLELAGGAVTVRGDTSQAQRHTSEARDAKAELDRLLGPFGVSSVGALRLRREQALAAEAAYKGAVRQREGVSELTSAALEAEITSRRAQVEDLRAKRVEDGAEVSHEALDEAALGALVAELVAQVRKAEADFEAARKHRDHLDRDHTAQTAAREEAARASAQAVARETGADNALDRHRDQHGATDTCQTRLDEAELGLKAAKARESQARNTLDRISSSAALRRETAQQRHERSQRAVLTLETQVQQLSEELDRESMKGAWSALGEVERSLETETARVQQLELNAAAARLLRDTIHAVRGEVQQRVVAPIKDELDQLIASATSGRYTLADLDDTLCPGTLEGGAGVRCEFDDGSQGLRELVATLIRLAVARHLAKTEPQVLILDDPCVHVSHQRTLRLVELLNDLTANHAVQALILTHRPGEFSGLLGAEIDVESV